MNNILKNMKVLGVLLILATGIIHLIEAPEHSEEAMYLGWLFYANGLGALIAAIGIYRKEQWGWSLGLAIAVGSIIGYVASRTVGLPMMPAEPDAWFEPMGIASLIVEGLYIPVFQKRR